MASNKRSLKAYVRYDGTGRVIAGSLILSRLKPKVGNWVETPAYECCNPPTEVYTLRLTFTSIDDANTLVGDATNVADWNMFFDLPNLGTPFTSVTIDGDTVVLTGGRNIKVKPALMYNLGYQYIVKVIDTGCITSVGGDAFSFCSQLTDVVLPNCTIVYGYQDSPEADYGGFGQCTNLVNVSIPKLVTVGDYGFSQDQSLTSLNFPQLETAGNVAFAGCSGLTSIYLPKLKSAKVFCFGFCSNVTSVTLPLATQIGDVCFYSCTSLISVIIPSCVNLGATVLNDSVFYGITLNTISLTIPLALMTCNAGNPDGDIQYLQANDTVTIITV